MDSQSKSGDSTHQPRAVDAARFRAQATGVGQTLAQSARTGAMRAQRVVDGTPPECSTVPLAPAAEGFPPRTPILTDLLGPARR